MEEQKVEQKSERRKQTMDGNHAAAYVAYAYTEVAAVYPITPSTVMAELVENWASQGKRNGFGRQVTVSSLQSEAGAAGTMHGALAAGSLATSFTASQGLLLMIPNLYKMAGERLPGVLHVAARTIASHALSIFGDHSDVYACRQTGAAMLCECSVQEVMDLSPVAHCAAIQGRIPFLNFFDGFRTSHEIQKIEVWDWESLRGFVDREAVEEFRDRSLNPNHGWQMGCAQNPDVFFQFREACNGAYENLPQIVQQCMDRINEKIGSEYRLFNYYGVPDPERLLVAMGSVCEAVEETVDMLRLQGEKVGLLKVHLYRPFSREAFLAEIPETVQDIMVLDRTKEPGALGEPLYLDVLAALKDSKFDRVPVFSGRYGISSKNTTPEQIMAVYHNQSLRRFTIGIEDDVTHLSLKPEKLPEQPAIEVLQTGTTSCKFWGLGADGTVGANKNSIKIIGDHSSLYVQAYFDYDSKKSGGVTISHLRFGKRPIRATYLIERADFVACHNPSYVYQYDMVQELVQGGTFLLNCPWDGRELEDALPNRVKRELARKQIHFYVIDGAKIGMESGLGTTRINTILQTAFFMVANIVPQEAVMKWIKEAVQETYGRKGREVVEKNCRAVDAAIMGLREIAIPANWNELDDSTEEKRTDDVTGENLSEADGTEMNLVRYVDRVQKKVNRQKGNLVPVSAILPYADGRIPSGSAAFEKRGIAVHVAVWDAEKCIECNQCAYVCPHAVIRPVVLTAQEAQEAPAMMEVRLMRGLPQYRFAMVVSAYDCTGCGACYEVCPAPGKAIKMEKFYEHAGEQRYFDYGSKLPLKPEILEKYKINTVKGSQFRRPLLEFHGACAGCGETAYAKLLTQLFGERMMIANATGCSSIWGNSFPATPYTKSSEGKGPAWSNSLFEDAAEFGYGMLLAQRRVRGDLRQELAEWLEQQENPMEGENRSATENHSEQLQESVRRWCESYEEGEINGIATRELIQALEAYPGELSDRILRRKEYLEKKSNWIFGGDGWAYDIGFGGLDHIMASGEDINVLVFDTEVYSNTGGQMSKSTPMGAVAQLCSRGKERSKKKLAEQMMTYGDVYVAQVSMGANHKQCLQAMLEAEHYHGPSLVIAYAPCINHGIEKGMGRAQEEEKCAVQSGYFPIFRYRPDAEGEDKLQFDGGEPTMERKEFLEGELRFTMLAQKEVQRASELNIQAAKQSQERIRQLRR